MYHNAWLLLHTNQCIRVMQLEHDRLDSRTLLSGQADAFRSTWWLAINYVCCKLLQPYTLLRERQYLVKCDLTGTLHTCKSHKRIGIVVVNPPVMLNARLCS